MLDPDDQTCRCALCGYTEFWRGRNPGMRPDQEWAGWRCVTNRSVLAVSWELKEKSCRPPEMGEHSRIQFSE